MYIVWDTGQHYIVGFITTLTTSTWIHVHKPVAVAQVLISVNSDEKPIVNCHIFSLSDEPLFEHFLMDAYTVI